MLIWMKIGCVFFRNEKFSRRRTNIGAMVNVGEIETVRMFTKYAAQTDMDF